MRRLSPADVLAAIGGAFSDVFGRTLGGLVWLCVVLGGLIAGALGWAGLTFLLPLIPWQGWLGVGADIAGAVAIVIVSLLLAPLVAMIVGGVLLDVAAERVEKKRFAADPPGAGLPPQRAIAASLRIAAVALPLNLLTLPLLFVPVLGLFVYWSVNGYLLGREYFSLAALRFRKRWEDARAVRTANGAMVFLAGLALAALMSVPVLNFLAPLFGISLMTRLHKKTMGAPIVSGRPQG
jgi:CysZ protein